eukprot:INCI541.3.p1 GENE.INCI541.3~~INCI541.3.p1  ORF type:complete len:690 (+),score=132.51 INCI541.3:227-2296(+)
MADDSAAPAVVDVSGLDAELARQITKLMQERDDAIGRCKNYQIQAATRESLLLALQSESDHLHSHSNGTGAPKDEISKAASQVFAGLKNASKRLFQKRASSSRHGSVDTGGQPLLKTGSETGSGKAAGAHTAGAAAAATTVAVGSGSGNTFKGSAQQGQGALADANDPDLARSVAYAVSANVHSNGGSDGHGGAITLGYNEMLEQKLKQQESNIQMLKLEVRQLRDLNENSAAELSAAQAALNAHAQDYAKLKRNLAVEKTLRDAADTEAQRLEDAVLLAEQRLQETQNALDNAQTQLRDLADRFSTQAELLARTKAAFQGLSHMQQVSETQLMEAEDKHTQEYELEKLRQEYDLLVNIKQSHFPQQGHRQNVPGQETGPYNQQVHSGHNGRAKRSASMGMALHTTRPGATLRQLNTKPASASNAASKHLDLSSQGSGAALRGSGSVDTLASPTSLSKDDPLQWLCRDNSNLDCPNIAVEGWLTKAATTKGKESQKQRYVRLRCLSTTKISLSYFAQGGGMDHLKRRLMLLPSCKIIETHPLGDPLVFSLTGVDAHDSSTTEIELVLRAPDASAKQLWLSKLRDSVEYLKELASASGRPTALDEMKATFCESCNTSFSGFRWRFHCYFCGNAFCSNCLDVVAPGPSGDKRRRCENCLPDMSHRLSTTLEAGRHMNASNATVATGYSRGS